jgi:hypothetical protein
MEHLEGTERVAYFMRRMHSRCSKSIIEESDVPNKREPATNAHNASKKANDAVLGLDVLKVKLEQLSIAVIKNWSYQSACETQI